MQPIAGEINFRGIRHVSKDANDGCFSAKGARQRGRRRLAEEGPCRLWVDNVRRTGASRAHTKLGRDPGTGNLVVFDGALDNLSDLRRRVWGVTSAGDHRSAADTLLALYGRDGIECVQSLRGSFALAVWDARQRRLFLARDRIGLKILYYAVTPDGIVFNSALGSLIECSAISSEIDDEALELYLQLTSVPAPWTIYRNVRKLPPAHWLAFDCTGLSLSRYWQLDYRTKPRLSDPEALAGFKEKLLEVLRLQTQGGENVGSFLSGGVDSSVVTRLLSEVTTSPVHAYSIGFEDKSFDETRYAEQAARSSGIVAHEAVLSSQAEHLLPEIPRCYGEPFADYSALPSLYVAKRAAQGVPVVFSGDGGDELLAGYSNYISRGSARWASSISARVLGRRGTGALAGYLAGVESFPARAVRRFLRDFISPELGGHLMLGGHWNAARRAALLGGRSRPCLVGAWRSQWIEQSFAHADNPIDRMLWIDTHTRLADTYLVKTGRACEFAGVDLRVPFVDHELMQFCASLPTEMKVRGSTGKFLLKALAEQYFPPEFVHRPKAGFAFPLLDWVRGSLRGTTREILLDRQLMSSFDRKEIENTITMLDRPRGYAANAAAGRIWTLLVYGLWRQSA